MADLVLRRNSYGSTALKSPTRGWKKPWLAPYAWITRCLVDNSAFKQALAALIWRPSWFKSITGDEWYTPPPNSLPQSRGITSSSKKYWQWYGSYVSAAWCSKIRSFVYSLTVDLNKYEHVKAKLTRGALILQKYRFTVTHVSATRNKLPDYLSNLSTPQSAEGADGSRMRPYVPITNIGHPRKMLPALRDKFMSWKGYIDIWDSCDWKFEESGKWSILIL